jgi:hypothetical protein
MSWNHDGASIADATGIEVFDELYGYALVLTRNQLSGFLEASSFASVMLPRRRGLCACASG